MSGSLRRILPWLAAALVVAGLDRWTKLLVLRGLQAGETIVVAPFFNLVLWFNSGAAFSFLAGGEAWQRAVLVAVAVAATIVIVWLLTRQPGDLLFCSGLSLILGGALGNLWDRIEHGRVVDFLLFHAGGYYWPAFNLADSAITLGAALVILDGFLSKHTAAPSERAADHSSPDDRSTP